MLLIALLFGCSPAVDDAPIADAVPPTAASTAAPAIDATAQARARAAMQTLGTTLKGELMAKMAAGGPTEALDVCSSSAQSLTATVGADLGVHVGRSSLRLRNPVNAPPEWVSEWLGGQGERPAEGAAPQSLSATDDHGNPVVRVVAPLAVEAPCLVCHGPLAGRSSELQSALDASYPQDQANDYSVGDLRGAIWAEVPVVETGLELPLNGDSKWALDDSTRAAMVQLRSVVSRAPATVDAAQQQASEVDAAVSQMIQGCEMEGAAHDQLHAFLMVLFPAIEALKGAEDIGAAAQHRGVLLALVAQFDAAFE